MNLLVLTLFAPLIGAFALLFFDKNAQKGMQKTALGVSLATFVISLFCWFGFHAENPDFQFMVDKTWIPAIDAGFRIGVDGMSMLLVMLTTFLMPIGIYSSFAAIKERHKEYYIMLLLLQAGMIGVFVSLDTFLFYVFWEVILIPMYFIIGIWGGQNRVYAALKFFIYTVVGSLFMLIAIIWLGLQAAEITGNGFTTNLLVLRDVAPQIPFELQQWLFIAFALSFCIKVPLFPVHTWLPDAHVQAPTAGSFILAGVLLKMGTYGLIRFNLELFPQSSFEFAPILAIFSVIGIIYGALVAMVQTDIKKLVAYSSVSHMGFIVLGIFSMTTEGLQGAIIQMVNHGLSTGALFLCVGVIYERRHTRELSEFGGLARVMPIYTIILGISVFASVGLPGLNGFVGEYLTLIGAFKSQFFGSWWYAIISATGVIFAAVYLLKMYQGVCFGTVSNDKNWSLNDLTGAETIQLIPLVVFMIWIGVYPSTFMKVTESSTKKLVGKLEMEKFGTSKYATVLEEAAKTLPSSTNVSAEETVTTSSADTKDSKEATEETHKLVSASLTTENQ
jgi:NADH-quinone oxidoreductase subunit M